VVVQIPAAIPLIDLRLEFFVSQNVNLHRVKGGEALLREDRVQCFEKDVPCHWRIRIQRKDMNDDFMNVDLIDLIVDRQGLE
jgi:hypothetical protein